jgi:quinoprotein glucose dehydrogenase
LSGVLLALRRAAGAWLYAAVFLFTLLWALWEVGLDGWALAPRLAGPFLLLLLLVLPLLPALRQEPYPHARATGRLAAFCMPAALVLGASFVLLQGPSAALSLHGAAAPPVAENPGGSPQGSAQDHGVLTEPRETAENWPAFGGSNAATRFSAARQITPQNVAQLTKAWEFHTGDRPPAGSKIYYSFENTSTKIGDSLYVSGLFNAQFMTLMERIAPMPPKAMRWRASVMLRTSLKRRMLAANDRRRAKMPGLQRMRLASSAKLPSRT